MKDKIRRWWLHNRIRIAFGECKQGIKNLWKWFPTIWRDRDWDHYYIYQVLIHKLEKQAEFIGTRGFHTTAKQDAAKMRLCAKLARMQQEDFYVYDYLNTYEIKWEFVPTDETKKLFELKTDIISDEFDAYFAKYQRQYRILDKKGKQPDEIAREIAHNNQIRSRKLLFKIIEENIEGWWD